MGLGTITDILNAGSSYGSLYIVYANVYVNQLSFQKITGNSYTLSYSVDYYSNHGGWAVNDEIIGAYLNISFNGTALVADSWYDQGSHNWGNPLRRSGTFTVNIPENTAISLYIQANSWAGCNSRYNETTAVTSQSFTLRRSEDQIITATSGNQNYILLPKADSTTSGKLYFYKNFSGTRSLICPPTNQTLDDVSLRCIYLYQYEGVILFNNGSNWYLASYYNKDGSSQNRLAPIGNAASSGKTYTAKISTSNILNASTTGLYYNWNLPDPASNSGEICILAYGGQYSDTSTLLITTSGSTGIDNGYYNNSTSKASIKTDGADKSTGVILVSNGTTWCIMGFYNTDGVAFGIGTGGTSLTTTSPLQINVSPSLSANRSLLLPPYSVGTNEVGSQILVLKTTAKSGGEPEYFRTNGTDKMGSGYFSYTSCDNRFRTNAYACTIFVSQKNPPPSSGNYLEYYPVCNY